MTKQILLTQEKVALVDDADYEWLIQRKWHAHRSHKAWYARRPEGRNQTVFMHREIMNASTGEEVDHIDGNSLNNTRANLRLCTMTQNQRNKPKFSNNTSGYKGVSWSKQKNKWHARIYTMGRNVHIGLFDSAVEAALAYDIAALAYYGEFARLNFDQAMVAVLDAAN